MCHRPAASDPLLAVAPPPVQPSESVPADPFQREQQRKQEAAVQKDRVRLSSPSSCDGADHVTAHAVFLHAQGNAYFKEGRYEAAVECYSRGMEADATNALLPANRAMAFLKLHR